MQEIGAANYAVLERIRVNRREDHLKVFICSEVTIHILYMHMSFFCGPNSWKVSKKLTAELFLREEELSFFKCLSCSAYI